MSALIDPMGDFNASANATMPRSEMLLLQRMSSTKFLMDPMAKASHRSFMSSSLMSLSDMSSSFACSRSSRLRWKGAVRSGASFGFSIASCTRAAPLMLRLTHRTTRAKSARGR